MNEYTTFTCSSSGNKVRTKMCVVHKGWIRTYFLITTSHARSITQLCSLWSLYPRRPPLEGLNQGTHIIKSTYIMPTHSSSSRDTQGLDYRIPPLSLKHPLLNPASIPLFPPQTGNSAPLTATPLLSTRTPIHGPTTGMLLANPAIVPRKSPKRMKMPYNSIKNPTSGQRKRMSATPPKNAAVPLSFCRRAKKSSVFCGPMIMVRPIRKRIYFGRFW